MQQYSGQIRVGLLGGGQLARMLALSAFNLGLEPHVLCPDASEPAAQVTRFWHKGSPKKVQDIAKFLDQVDVATFESEFLDCEILKQAQKVSSTPLLPRRQIMDKIQDRESQKTLLDKNKIPTSPWLAVNDESRTPLAVEQLGYPLVFKKRQGGYDGYGTFVVKNDSQLKEFREKHYSHNNFIAEKWIPFRRELAVIVARSRNGNFTHFPLVESLQKDSRCYWIKGPVKCDKLKPLLSKIKKMLNSLDYAGVMGVEFFDSRQGILVNELAPRVHNTGHYTIDTSGLSQFDLHWHCLLGHKLPKVLTKDKGFAMVNLLSEGHSSPQFALSSEAQTHWYGKSEHRPGRKMGHLNSIGKSPKEALKKALKAEKGFHI